MHVGPIFDPITHTNFSFVLSNVFFLDIVLFIKALSALIPLQEESISRDVTFDENVFPFSQHQPNVGARLRQEISLLPPDLRPSTSDQGGELLDDHMFNSTNPCDSACDEVCAEFRNPEVQQRVDIANVPGADSYEDPAARSGGTARQQRAFHTCADRLTGSRHVACRIISCRRFLRPDECRHESRRGCSRTTCGQ